MGRRQAETTVQHALAYEADTYGDIVQVSKKHIFFISLTCLKFSNLDYLAMTYAIACMGCLFFQQTLHALAKLLIY